MDGMIAPVVISLVADGVYFLIWIINKLRKQ